MNYNDEQLCWLALRLAKAMRSPNTPYGCHISVICVCSNDLDTYLGY